MARLAQYWLMDFYSRVLDQRMSIIGKMRTRIMMGQTRQTSDDLTEHEEQDRHATGYINEPKNKSYLPSSVHGSPRHMAALAKNQADRAYGTEISGWIDHNNCNRKNWSWVWIPKTWIQFFLANLANFYESLKRGAKDRNPLANNNFRGTQHLQRACRGHVGYSKLASPNKCTPCRRAHTLLPPLSI